MAPERQLAHDIWFARYRAAVGAVTVPTDQQIALFQCLVEALDAPIALPKAASATSLRMASWTLIVQSLQRLDRPGGYVGTFRTVVSAVAAKADELPEPDREVLALLLVHAAAHRASLATDFDLALGTARVISPTTIRAATAVDAVLRIGLRAAATNPATLPAAVLATLRLAAASSKPVLDQDAMWAVREALALIPMTDDLRQAICSLNSQDRARVEVSLDPSLRRRSLARRLLHT